MSDAELEELLTGVDLRGTPGVFWTVVGTAAVLSLFVVTELWRLSQRVGRRW